MSKYGRTSLAAMTKKPLPAMTWHTNPYLNDPQGTLVPKNQNVKKQVDCIKFCDGSHLSGG